MCLFALTLVNYILLSLSIEINDAQFVLVLILALITDVRIYIFMSSLIKVLKNNG